MTAVLLAVCLAQLPPGGAFSPFEQEINNRLYAAILQMAKDPPGAVQALTALIDDPQVCEKEEGSPAVRSCRDQARYFRASLLLQQGRAQAQAVADDMTALINREREWHTARTTMLLGTLSAPLPSSPLAAIPLAKVDNLQSLALYQMLGMRAAAWRALGETAKEQADRAELEELLRVMRQTRHLFPEEDPDDESSPWPESIGGVPGAVFSVLATPLLVPIVCVVMVPVFFLLGLRQRRDARGSWWRLFWVALALALLQVVPILVAFLVAGGNLRVGPGPTVMWVALLVFLINVARHRAYLHAVHWQGTKEAPPLLEDRAVVARIEEIAGRMGVAPPVTRLVRSASAQQTNNAMISGVAAPTLILFDGILYRLSEEERDVIIAHELAHLANHTFWYWLIAGTACGVAVVVASAFYPVLVALCLGATLLTGTWIILCRRLELDCDRRAARAIGHRRAASALWKIHADRPSRGLLEFLVGAVGTHPSRDERLAAILLDSRSAASHGRDAPEGDRPEEPLDSRVLARRHLAAWVAAGLWLGTLVACLVWGLYWPGSYWPGLPLLLMEASLVTLSWLALGKQARRRKRLQRTRQRWLGWIVPGLLIAFLVAYYSGLTQVILSPMTNLGILLGLLLGLGLTGVLRRRDQTQNLNRQAVIAIQSNDWPKALALCEGNLAIVARSPVLRYNLALIRAVLGRREEALADLEQLRADEPGFKMTWLLLASLYADEGDYARALERAEQLTRDLPNEPSGRQAEAWLLRKVGRLDEAEARAKEVLAKDPDAGQGYLTLAGVALDRGDVGVAREFLARAERHSPGMVGVALVAAEIALAADGPGAALAVERAVEAARNNPLAFADKAAAALARRLEQLRQGVVPAQVALGLWEETLRSRQSTTRLPRSE
jgi:Zn-dependent protease with chaperone function/tetratricopeptide (TPR) repeat protein